MARYSTSLCLLARAAIHRIEGTMSGPESRFYESQGLRLHYADWGNEEAPPLILIHGGRDHCRSWDAIAQSLQPHFHVLAPDLRDMVIPTGRRAVATPSPNMCTI